jgi:hypothetical protein
LPIVRIRKLVDSRSEVVGWVYDLSNEHSRLQPNPKMSQSDGALLKVEVPKAPDTYGGLYDFSILASPNLRVMPCMREDWITR